MNDFYRNKYNIAGFRTKIALGQVEFPAKNVLCGSSAGLTATALTYPLDLIRTRILYTTAEQTEYKTWGRTLVTVWNYESDGFRGIRNFYQGIYPALIGMVFYAGVSFGTYETLKERALLIDQGRLFFNHKDDDGSLLKVSNFTIGAITGVISQCLVFPVDTARRRMQNAQLIPSQNRLNNQMSVRETLLDLWRRSPNKYFPTLVYKGVSLNIIRAVPSSAISFTTYEYLCKQLNITRY